MTTASEIQAAYGIDSSLAQAIVSVALAVGIRDAGWLANVINFESAGFNPKAYNKYSGATGLIQFTPDTAEELGTTTSHLMGLSATQQMEYVQRYFQLSRIRQYAPFTSQLDTFLAVYYPSAIGKGMSYTFPESTWAGNPGIRTAADYYNLAMKNAKLPGDGALASASAFASSAFSNLFAAAGVMATPSSSGTSSASSAAVPIILGVGLGLGLLLVLTGTGSTSRRTNGRRGRRSRR